jgi:hypothetical protein
MIRILDYKEAGALAARKTQRFEEAERVVAPILENVRKRGDAALLEYARKFDGYSGASVRIRRPGGWTPSSSARLTWRRPTFGSTRGCSCRWRCS